MQMEKKPDSEMGVYIGPCDLTSVKLIQKGAAGSKAKKTTLFSPLCGLVGSLDSNQRTI